MNTVTTAALFFLLSIASIGSTCGQEPPKKQALKNGWASTEKVDEELRKYMSIYTRRSDFKIAAEYQIKEGDSEEVVAIKKWIEMLTVAGVVYRNYIGSGKSNEFLIAYFENGKKLIAAKLELAISKDKKIELITSHLDEVNQLLHQELAVRGPGLIATIATYRAKVKLQLIRAKK